MAATGAGPAAGRAEDAPTGTEATGSRRSRTVSVLPDVSGVDRTFDYELPDGLAPRVTVGTVVRVPLHGRRVRGWVVGLDAPPPAGVALRAVLEVVSVGPAPDVVALARFGAWRYAGRLRPFLLTASAPRLVKELPAAPARRQVQAAPPGVAGAAHPGAAPAAAAVAEATRTALGRQRAVLRLPPAGSRLALVESALAELSGRGAVLVLVPERRDAETLARRLAANGHGVALQPDGWAQAAAGAPVVVGTRAAALAPVRGLGGVVVLDAHAEALVETRSPTWNAWVLVAERAARAGAPCLLASACPTLEQLDWGELVVLPRAAERAGWAPLEVLDRRRDDPRSGLYSERLAPLVRAARAEEPGRQVLCVLNRTGRARLLACGACGELARCESCGAAVVQRERPAPGEAGRLECPRCGAGRPLVCAACGSSRLKLLRVGVQRAAEELAALTGEEVAEVSGPASPGEALPGAPVLVGTEAVLHRARHASAVVFLDFDQELLAPRLHAGEQALALLAQASRLVGGRRAEGRRTALVAVQTRLADHEVVLAALRGDPDLLARPERERREALRLPPARALALVSGEGSAGLLASLATQRAGAGGGAGAAVESAALGPDRFLVRARDAAALADALEAAGRPTTPVRIEVDPWRY